MGAPITAFTRLDDEPIRIHSNIYEPDMVVIVDETLTGTVDVRRGLKPDGRIVINTSRKPELIAAEFEGFDGDVYAIDAADISLRCLGRNLPNTPLLSVDARLTGIIEESKFFEIMGKIFLEKFAPRQEVVKGNINALREAWNGAVLVNGD
jgi:pyruvate ferredoxin oxidoreductase gamma subunit